jgi:hypothetical protein
MRRARASTSSQAAALFLLLFVGTISSGCKQLNDWLGIPDPWAGYYDPTENFIAARGLDQQDLTKAGYQGSAKWTWAWRGADDASDTGGFSYMTLTQDTSVSPPPGLPATTPVYNLELLNLYPGGGGDFENPQPPVLPPAHWGLGNYLPSNVVFSTLSGTSGINGTSLRLDIGGSSYAFFDFTAIADHSVSSSLHTYDWIFLADGSSYEWLYSASPQGDDNLSSLIPQSLAAKQDNSIGPLYVKAPPTVGYLLFGGKSPMSFAFDDIRILRSDIAPDSRIRLLLTPPDTSEKLRSGYYEFVLWARKTPSRHFVNESGATQPYAASKVTLSMLSIVLNARSGPQYAFPLDGSTTGLPAEDSITYDAATGWSRIRLRMSPGNNFDIDSSSTTPVLELAVFPFDYAKPQPGTVQIADPELHFYKDGYN